MKRALDKIFPIIGAWFTRASDEEMSGEHFKKIFNAFAKNSSYSLITMSMRNVSRCMSDENVHDWFKEVAIYAKNLGLDTIIDLDIRQSIPEFQKRYPNVLQQRLWLDEIKVNPQQESKSELAYAENHCDAIFKNTPIKNIHLERAYTYKKNPSGIEQASIKDITTLCKALPAEVFKTDDSIGKKIEVTIPAVNSGDTHACVIYNVTLNYPDVFADEYLKFEDEVVAQYADLPLSGLMKDECGLPVAHDGNPNKNCFWYSKNRSRMYADRTNGRDLIYDTLLMCYGIDGLERERQFAINHFFEMARIQISKIGEHHHEITKSTFGASAFDGVHETVIPYPDPREFERNALTWWSAARDYAQSDETTPYCCRTSLAKKFNSPIWYNQWYAPTLDLYEKPLWSYALAGGRMNFHPLHWNDRTLEETTFDVMDAKLQQANLRISMLDYITKKPLNCPVAVIFGHTSAMNWADEGYEDVGMEAADFFWSKGYYADLIPSSELKYDALRVDEDGNIWFGPQRYSAVVLCNPQFENMELAQFFQQADKGNAILARIGKWDRNFNGDDFDADKHLPKRMLTASNINDIGQEIITSLNSMNVQPLTKATVTFPKWHNIGSTSQALPSAGKTVLIDGTVLRISGEDSLLGDPIQETLVINDQKIVVDAIGVVGIRLNIENKIEALACGGLKNISMNDFSLELPARTDFAIWKDKQNEWQGVIIAEKNELPNELRQITSNWQYLERIPSA